MRARVLREEDDCWLCGKPVDKTLPPFLHGSPEIDEIVPVSLGGSPIDRTNCRLAHRLCNIRRGNSAGPSANRRVVLVAGPPGAGKSTYAHTLGLTVYDFDDDKWHGSDYLFRQALAAVAKDPNAQAVVIRCAATQSARAKAARECAATETLVIETDLQECIKRIAQRGRSRPPIRTQIAAAQTWWRNYERGEARSSPKTLSRLTTSRTWATE